jgi:hypothetical protein
MRVENFRLSAWVALAAILLNAFAATVSYAVAAGAGLSVVEMCTTFGLKKVAVSNANGDGGSQAPLDHGVKHCPFCLSADHTPALFKNAQAVALPYPVHTPEALPDPGFHFDPLFKWAAALRHGPPARA